MSRLEVRKSNLDIGRGVFVVAEIAAGEVFECSPVLTIPAAQRANLDKTDLYDYYFDWVDGDAAIALGVGSLFNHSFEPNARYSVNAETHTIDFTALVKMAAGIEVFVNYNGDPESQKRLWFETSRAQ